MEYFFVIVILLCVIWYCIWLVRSSRKKDEENARAAQIAQKKQEELQRVRQEYEEARLAEQIAWKERFEASLQKSIEADEAELTKWRRIEAEQESLSAEKHAAYDSMVESIQDYEIVPSDTPAKKIAISFLNGLTYSSITKRSSMEKLGDFVCIDTETTGLRCTSDEIIDIAAIRFRGFQPVAKISMLLAPKKPIPETATAINHITNEMVEGKPSFPQIAETLVEFIGDDNLVGHNLPFDLKFIVHYGADVTKVRRKYFDTLAIAQKTVPKVRMKWDREYGEYVEDFESIGVSNHKLQTLCAYFGIVNKKSHRAENDALATGLLFKKLAEIRIQGTK